MGSEGAIEAGQIRHTFLHGLDFYIHRNLIPRPYRLSEHLCPALLPGLSSQRFFHRSSTDRGDTALDHHFTSCGDYNVAVFFGDEFYYQDVLVQGVSNGWIYGIVFHSLTNVAS